MSRLIALTDYMGAPVAVNPAHITEVHQRIEERPERGPRVDILLVNSTPGDDDTVLTVMGTFDEIVARINDEPRHVCGQLHPDVTDVLVMPVKAHPNAIGWVQHPELPT